MSHWIFSEEHEMFRKTLRTFLEKEVVPHIEEWEKKREIPRELFLRMGSLHYLGIGYKEEYGGSGLDAIMEAVLLEELARCGAGGVSAAIGAHSCMAMTVIKKYGSQAQKEKYLVPGIAGEMIAALAVTEPSGGSDVAAMKMRAKRDGDQYILNGSKAFITNGALSDFVIVAAKTSEEPKHGNVSLFIVENGAEGFTKGKKLRKLGWRSSDTTQLFFENVRVSKDALIGEENHGFHYLMENFQFERIALALGCIGSAQKALQLAMKYSKERIQFDVPLSQFQVLRHKMVDMAVDIEKAKAITYRALYQYNKGEDCTTEASMAKAFSGEMVQRVCDEALQIHGGNGYMMEFPIQRLWRDARLQSIGGGTTQMMNDILVKRLGIISEVSERQPQS